MAIDINISTTFLGNTDTPNSYVGQANKVVSVKSDASGLEFTTISISDTNIYNTDGTLTANRTVTHNGFTLTFNGKTQIKCFSASASDVQFNVRNFGNTGDVFQVLGNGSVYSQGKNFGARDTIYGINAGANIDPSAYHLTFFGFQAGLGVTGGACSAFGESCMQGDSTLSSAFGAAALQLGGSSMCAFGANSARKIGNQRGVFIGNDAGYDWANSISNTLIGWGVAAGITSGNNNVILGGYNVTTPSTLVTSNRNTLLGDRQWDFPSTMKGSVVLGYEAKATGDNQFSVGSVAENAGAVATEGFTQALTWRVKINGVDYKIPLQLA